tara:strand:+ start:4267 stop:4962 length:696 start_codon:yes stop_codon:yes gene_type:complete
MKKIIHVLAFFFSLSISAQDLYWYDVILDVKNNESKAFEKAVDEFYSSADFPEGVTMTFSNIQIKGQNFKETHILSFVSPSSNSLADFRSSLSGDKWEEYLDIVRPYINSARTSVGNASNLYNEDKFNPIGQAWAFKVKNIHIPAFTNAFKKSMETIQFPGFVGLARVTHGLSNGENLIIYGTYSNLNEAFTFENPKNDAEAKAFAEFFEVTAEIAEFTQTWTRVKIKDYN